MAWPVPSSVIVDDKDFDDAALWAAIDSAAAATLSSSETREPLALKRPNLHSPIPNLHPSPPPSKPFQYDSRVSSDHRPFKIARYCSSEISPPPPTMAVVKHVQRTPPTTPAYSPPVAYSVSSPGNGVPFSSGKEQSSVLNSEGLNWRQSNEKEDVMRHSLSGRFPTVSLFKEYQNAAMAILEKSDYMMISGRPYIKKSGWRKISFYFNVSYEIKDKTIEFDENRNVQRAEFVVRAYMQGGRFSDGWGSCERREKRFLKPNHDIPSTAETRAKNKACQDLLGIGEYRSGASHVQR